MENTALPENDAPQRLEARGFVSLGSVVRRGNKTLLINMGNGLLEVDYDQSAYTPDLERRINEAAKDGRPGGMLAGMLSKILVSWKLYADVEVRLPARPGKMEQVGGVVSPEKELIFTAGDIIPLTPRVLDQLLDVFTLGRISEAIMRDQSPKTEISSQSADFS